MHRSHALLGLEASLRYIDIGQTVASNPDDDHRLLCDYNSAVGRLWLCLESD